MPSFWKKLFDDDYTLISRHTHNIIAPVAAGVTALLTLGVAIATFFEAAPALIIALSAVAFTAGVVSAVSWLKGKAPKADHDEIDQRDRERRNGKSRSKSQELEKEKDVELNGTDAAVTKESKVTQTSCLDNEEYPSVIAQHQATQSEIRASSHGKSV